MPLLVQASQPPEDWHRRSWRSAQGRQLLATKSRLDPRPLLLWRTSSYRFSTTPSPILMQRELGDAEMRSEWPARWCSCLALEPCTWSPGSLLPVWVEKSFPFSYWCGSTSQSCARYTLIYSNGADKEAERMGVGDPEHSLGHCRWCLKFSTKFLA